MINNNDTIRLLQAIGSPFDSRCKKLPESEKEAKELFELATKNKIGLLYLDSLNKFNLIEKFNLSELYFIEKKKHAEQEKTAIRISEIFNQNSINYAIFKSIMPFPATPNDVDIINFGDIRDYKIIAQIMNDSGYDEVFGQADTQQRMFHDVLNGGQLIPHPKKKDVYDIDIYHEISASFMIYLDKQKIEKYVTDVYISEIPLRMLSPQADLLAIIIHSIIPEMICTLFVYYANLYYISNMTEDEISQFIELGKYNFILYSLIPNFMIISDLHHKAHGFIPQKIEFIMKQIGLSKHELSQLRKNNFKMPHKYSNWTISKIMMEKLHENIFRKSFLVQLCKMTNPRMLKWVIKSYIVRKARDTY